MGPRPRPDSLQAALGQPLATPVDTMRRWLGDALRLRGVPVRIPSGAGSRAVALTTTWTRC